jgi:hypothetical protein
MANGKLGNRISSKLVNSDNDIPPYKEMYWGDDGISRIRIVPPFGGMASLSRPKKPREKKTKKTLVAQK